MRDRNSKKWVTLGVAVGLIAILIRERRTAERALDLSARPGCEPGTALVTGASSGIGAAFARRLAELGYDLVLVARRADRLEALAKLLQGKFGIQAEALPADLSRPEEVKRVELRIEELTDLVLLVNNAGFGITSEFTETDPDREVEMIQVHAIASERLARAAMPAMVAWGRGAIINVSSLSAFVPEWGNVTYTATKAFLNNFSLSLQSELRGTGVHVQALCPGFTITEFHSTPEFRGMQVRSLIPRLLWMSPEVVVEHSLNALPAGPVVVIPGLVNQAIAILARTGLISLIFELFGGWIRELRQRV